MHIFARAMAWQLVPLTRSEEGLFFFTYYKNYYRSKKIDVARFFTCWVPLGSGLWHTTDADITGACPSPVKVSKMLIYKRM